MSRAHVSRFRSGWELGDDGEAVMHARLMQMQMQMYDDYQNSFLFTLLARLRSLL